MISHSSSLASSVPATSANVIFGLFSVRRRALVLPNENNPLGPPCICRIMNNQIRMKISQGENVRSNVVHENSFAWAATVTPAVSRRSTSLEASGNGRVISNSVYDACFRDAAPSGGVNGVLNTPCTSRSVKVTDLMLPFSSSELNSL